MGTGEGVEGSACDGACAAGSLLKPLELPERTGSAAALSMLTTAYEGSPALGFFTKPASHNPIPPPPGRLIPFATLPLRG